MAKMFRTSGTGAQQQTLDTTDEKIKIYATDTALDTDLTNIPDGEIVATKENAGGGGSGYVGEIPLGTWASFENDTAPNSEWIQAGTTFDANAYPALAMMLGGNTVPERFDHNRLGDWESITISGDSNNPTVMPYDGYLTVKDAYTSNNGFSSIFVDGVSVNQVNMAGATGDSAYNGDGTGIPFKKGQSIYIYAYNSRSLDRHIAYYKHPMFIKATPTSSDSDYEGTLNSIREFYVRNNTYSTEERLTGGVWIDGKPIYRVVHKIWENGQPATGYTYSGNMLSGPLTVNAETIVNAYTINTGTNYRQAIMVTTGESGPSQAFCWFSDNTAYFNYGANVYLSYAVIEYTKTTD